MTANPAYKSATILTKEWVTPKVLKVTFDSDINFAAGQFVSLNVAPNTFRAYSIASSPYHQGQFSIVADAAHDGAGANFLKAIEPKQTTNFVGPSGRFKLPHTLAKRLVFIATGTGIAPFVSMFYQLQKENYDGEIVLLWGLRNETELYFTDELPEFKTKLTNFEYKMCYSDSNGRVTKFVAEYIKPDTYYFLCGNPNMIEDAKHLLANNGVGESAVFFEKFTVSKPK